MTKPTRDRPTRPGARALLNGDCFRETTLGILVPGKRTSSCSARSHRPSLRRTAVLRYAHLWFPRTEALKGIASMRIQNLLVCAVIFTATVFTANLGFAQAPARGQGRGQ